MHVDPRRLAASGRNEKLDIHSEKRIEGAQKMTEDALQDLLKITRQKFRVCLIYILAAIDTSPCGHRHPIPIRMNHGLPL